MYLHYNVDTLCKYIIFVRYLNWAKNNQQVTEDLHSDIILGLTSFLTSYSNPDHICRF